jgi:hypothetical protein
MKHHRYTQLLPLLLSLLLVTGAVLLPATRSAHAAAMLQLQPNTAEPHDQVHVQGSGFHAGDTVTLTAGIPLTGGASPANIVWKVQASTGGSFLTTFTVPGNRASGVDAVSAHDTHDASATTYLSLPPIVTLNAGGHNTTPVTVTAGHRFFVTGGGYAPGETVQVEAPFNAGAQSSSRAQVKATSAGRLDHVLLNVPLGAHISAYPVQAIGLTSKKVGWAEVKVTYEPTLAAHVSATSPNIAIQITGQDFYPRDTVNVAIPSMPSVIAHNVRVDDRGQISTTLKLSGSTPSGTYTIKATDIQHHFSAQANVTTTTTLPVPPRPVSLTSASPVVAGHNVTVNGTGFLPNEQVTLSATVPLYTGGTVASTHTVRVDGSGNLTTATLSIPNGARAQSIRITARGTSSGRSASASTTVTYAPSLTTHPNPVGAGASLTVTGHGFVPHSVVTVALPVPVTSGTVTLNAHPTVNGNGDFSVTVSLPRNARTGAVTASARGSLAGFHSATTLHVMSAAALSPATTRVAPGGVVPLTGTGFTPYATIHLTATVNRIGGGTETVSRSVRTDAQGHFTSAITVPRASAPGQFTLKAQGPSRGASSTLTVTSLAPSITLQPTATLPGAPLTVQGSNFPAGDTVTVKTAIQQTSGGTRTLQWSILVNARGTFTLHVTLPSDIRPGTLTLRAISQATGRTTQANLRIALSPTVTVSPSTSQPGGSIQIRGGGFSVNASIAVTVSVPLYGGGTRTLTSTAHTGSDGAFSTTLTLPGNAAPGSLTVVARGPNTTRQTSFTVSALHAAITISPLSLIPGGNATVAGSGFLANDTIQITVQIATTSGPRTLNASVHTDSNGRFTTTIAIPTSTSGGTYTVQAKSLGTGRTPQAHLTVVHLKPSAVVTPSTTTPGAIVTVSGFGFATGDTVTVRLNGTQLAQVQANASGNATARITVPASTASGASMLTLDAASGRSASTQLQVKRAVVSVFHFASLYTGTRNRESIDLLNPTSTPAHVTITYQRTNGQTHRVALTVGAHRRYTRDVNADLGPKVSAAATVSSDVAIAADRLVRQAHDGAIVPGTHSPAKVWYFADGNTSGAYRMYLAAQNPNTFPVRVSFRILPTHHAPFTVVRTMAPTSRVTLNVKKYVKDAVGAVVSAPSPIVVNRTIKIKHGVTSKIGVAVPQRTWYFAGGPRTAGTHAYIGIINPGNGQTSVTVHLYLPSGREVRTLHTTMRAGGRLGYNLGKLTGHTDVAAAVTASRGVVAEQTTYHGRHHDEATDATGVVAPTKTWAFAAVDTTAGISSSVNLFNPALTAAPIVVQFMSTSGVIVQRTYVVGPLQHRRIDVGSVMPNVQGGIIASSSSPFVALYRQAYGAGRGAMTSHGEHL